jgi:hypothetical protein
MYVLFLGKVIPVSNLHITKVYGTESPTQMGNGHSEAPARFIPGERVFDIQWTKVSESLCRDEENNYNASIRN